MSASATPHGNRLALAGRIAADNAVSIRRQGERWLSTLAADAEAFVDLSGVTSASTVLLSLLLCLRRTAQAGQVALVVAGASDDLLGLSHLNGVSRWLTGPG